MRLLTSFAFSSILSTPLRYILLMSGEIFPLGRCRVCRLLWRSVLQASWCLYLWHARIFLGIAWRERLCQIMSADLYLLPVSLKWSLPVKLGLSLQMPYVGDDFRRWKDEPGWKSASNMGSIMIFNAPSTTLSLIVSIQLSSWGCNWKSCYIGKI